MELRRPARLVALSAGAAVSVALALAPSSLAEESVGIVGWHPYAPAWDALSVEPGERAVVLGITSAACGSRDLTVTVSETAHAVRFVVRTEYAEYAPGFAISCPSPRRTPVTEVLKRRLAGRQIEGQSAATAEGFEVRPIGGVAREGNVIPRLIGFSPRDAKDALRRLSLRAAFTHARVASRSHGLSRVTAQRPAPETFLTRGATVRLRLSG